jgi:hypothetical protein
MNGKFSSGVFVFKGSAGFFEYDCIEDLVADQGEQIANEIIGYFPSMTNITYAELSDIKEETTWTIAYYKNDAMLIKHINSTLELKISLDKLITESDGIEYVTIYKNNDIVYLN